MAGNPILVLAEVQGSEIAPIAFEMLTVARAVAAASGQEVVAAIAGPVGSGKAAAQLWERGVQRVYVSEHQALADGRPEAVARAVQSICAQSEPGLVVIGQTPLGRELAPFLARKLGAGVVMNCIDLRIHQASGELEAVCPVYGGVAEAVFRFAPNRPRVVAVRHRVARAAPAEPGRAGTTIAVDPRLESFRQRVATIAESASSGPQLETAQVIVSGGLGLQERDNYRQIEDLAAALGGAPAATRAIVDRGWVPATQQVGITGRAVAPALYLAIGISGASQHMAGLARSTAIVAVNTDRNAAIFRHARFGIVQDCTVLLPALLQEVRERKGRA